MDGPSGINMLSSQLDTLKRIDREEATRAVRPPVILAQCNVV